MGQYRYTTGQAEHKMKNLNLIFISTRLWASHRTTEQFVKAYNKVYNVSGAIAEMYDISSMGNLVWTNIGRPILDQLAGLDQ